MDWPGDPAEPGHRVLGQSSLQSTRNSLVRCAGVLDIVKREVRSMDVQVDRSKVAI